MPVVVAVPQLGDLRVLEVVVEAHRPVDDAAGADLDDAVGDRGDELVVVAGEEEDAREIHQPLVERLDRLQVEVVASARRG